jgi:hypothetical protein
LDCPVEPGTHSARAVEICRPDPQDWLDDSGFERDAYGPVFRPRDFQSLAFFTA